MNLEKQKENFKNHRAIFKDLGNIKILDFKKPNSTEYRIRFLFEEDIRTKNVRRFDMELKKLDMDDIKRRILYGLIILSLLPLITMFYINLKQDKWETDRNFYGKESSGKIN